MSVTAGGRNHLKSLPLAKLKKYVNAYNIKIDRAVEKDDFIDAILDARVRPPLHGHARILILTYPIEP